MRARVCVCGYGSFPFSGRALLRAATCVVRVRVMERVLVRDCVGVFSVEQRDHVGKI